MTAPQTHETPLAGGASQNNEADGFGGEIITTAAAPQPVDLAQAERFLTLLDETAETWHFRTIHPVTADAWNYPGTLDNVAAQLARDNAAGYGVFVTVNEGGTKGADITRVRAVFADFDPPKTAGMPEPSKLALEPHFIVESSPGKHHPYWLVDGLQTHEFKATQQAIIAAYDSDPEPCDLPRIMRLPGFLHTKGAPFLTRIIHESGELPYSADKIRKAWPAKRPETPPAPAQASPVAQVDADRHKDVNRLSAHLAALVVADGMDPAAAMEALRAERDRGRYSRTVDDDELRRGLDGAVDKYRSGEWTLPAFARAVPAANDEPATLQAVPLSGFMAKRQPEHPHVMPPYPRRVVTLLGGHGGAGKTTLAVTHAAHIATGCGWGPFDAVPGRAVFLSFEDEGADILRTLQDVVDVYGLPADEIEQNLVIFDGTDSESELAVESGDGARLDFTAMMEVVEQVCTGADIIFIDNASDTFGGNENSRRQVKAFIRRLARKLARANNAAVVLLAHIDKQAARGNAHGNNYSGSTAWHNGARSRLALVENEDGGLELLHEKARWGGRADPVRLQRAQGGVPVPVSASEANAAQAAAQALVARSDADEVLEVLRRAVAVLPDGVPTATTGPRTTWTVLALLPDTPAWMKERRNKRRVEAALIALETAGTIRRRDIQRSNRHPVARWTVEPALNVAA